MTTRRCIGLSVILSVMLLAACSRHLDASSSANATQACDLHGLSADQFKLAQGYSLLYEDADDVTKFKLELALKDTSKAAGTLLSDFIDYDDSLKRQLKQLAKAYPAVRIDLPARSDVEEQERFAIGKDYLLDFAPLVGVSGHAFERKALLFFLVFVDEQRHLTAILADKESNPALKQAMSQAHDRLDQTYKQYDALLNRAYFTHPDAGH